MHRKTNPSARLRRTPTLAMLALAALLLAAPAPLGAEAPEKSAPPSLLIGEVASRGDQRAIAGAPGALRPSPLLLDPQLLAEGPRRFALPAPGGESLTLELDLARSLARGGYALTGRVVGYDAPGGRVLLVAREGLLVGTVRLADRAWRLRPDGAGGVVVEEVAAQDHGDDMREPPAALAPLRFDAQPGAIRRTSGPEAVGDEDPARLDVMIVYTKDAERAAGGPAAIDALVDYAILESNDAYAARGMGHALRRVHAQRIDYVETGDGGLDLDRLTYQSDGYLEEVHALRDLYGADIVTMWTESGACGLAWVMHQIGSWFEPYAFNVGTISCANGNLTYPHELGHNMGARHDWYVDDALDSPRSHNKGHVDEAARWRTIMAYNSECAAKGFNCTRIPHFSNPEVSWSGAPTGVAIGTDVSCAAGNLANPECDADIRDVFAASVPVIANFRATTFYATIAKSGTPSIVEVGEAVAVTLSARNDTSTTAMSLVIEDEVPEGFVLDVASLSADAIHEGTGPGSLITWSTGADLAPGQELVRSYTLLAAESGVTGTRAAVRSSNGATASPSNLLLTTVAARAACGFTEGFESGVFGPHWRSETTAKGRARVSSEVPAEGVYAAILDASSNDTFSEAGLFFTGDFAGVVDLQLTFRWRDLGDEYHAAYDGVFIRQAAGDPWQKVHDFDGAIHDVYQDALIDLDAAAGSLGLSLMEGFQVKFGQYDNFYANPSNLSGSDGYAIHALELYCTPGEAAETGEAALVPLGKEALSWGGSANFSTYRLYRGSAGDLMALATGDADACLRHEGPDTTLTGLTELPGVAEGQLFWYLVVGVNPLGEGPAGDATSGPRSLESRGECVTMLGEDAPNAGAASPRGESGESSESAESAESVALVPPFVVSPGAPERALPRARETARGSHPR